MRNVVATGLLEMAEYVYLYAHGWRRKNHQWHPPADYPFSRCSQYTRSHAVNAQKQLTYNPLYGGTRE